MDRHLFSSLSLSHSLSHHSLSRSLSLSRFTCLSLYISLALPLARSLALHLSLTIYLSRSLAHYLSRSLSLYLALSISRSLNLSLLSLPLSISNPLSPYRFSLSQTLSPLTSFISIFQLAIPLSCYAPNLSSQFTFTFINPHTNFQHVTGFQLTYKLSLADGELV